MKITYNWLKDFVEIKIPPKELAEKLTMAGLEVTSLEEREGDTILEIEITSNRPDWLSVVGIAQEVAAITGQKLKLGSGLAVSGYRLAAEHRKPNTESRNLKLTIEDKKDCPLYTAKIIKNVKVGPSPKWLSRRLELIGCRSINNIVDITNYIMFSWGEPLHAFDLEKLNSDVIGVRRAVNNEKIVTIDTQERALGPEILVITAGKKPVAIAGIMGGKASEVTASTQGILLEAAVFNPAVVRRGRQKLGMQTDSSYRFERGMDLETAETSSWRAVRLIREIAGGVCLAAKSSSLVKSAAKTIRLNTSFSRKILGVDLGRLKTRHILEALGLKVQEKAKGALSVTVPGRRQDLSQEIDLVEEIARIYGYANIPRSIPAAQPQISPLDTREIIWRIKNILAGLGLQEVITPSLIDADLLKNCPSKIGSPAIEIANPLSREQGILRPSLIPSLVRCVAYNLNQKQDYINIFEIAEVFSSGRQGPTLGIALCGIKPLLLAEQGLIKEKTGLLHLKGISETLLERLGVKGFDLRPADNACLAEICIGQEKAGTMQALEAGALRYFDIKNKDVVVSEIFLEKILPHVCLGKHFVALPKYPGISRDISFVIAKEIPLARIYAAIQEKAGPLLRQAKVVDYYYGQQIPAGWRGLTISCFYRADQRTLTEEEINPLHQALCALLTERFGVKLR